MRLTAQQIAHMVRHMTPEQAAAMWKILVDKGIV
jgi:hypothetical protein